MFKMLEMKKIYIALLFIIILNPLIAYADTAKPNSIKMKHLPLKIKPGLSKVQPAPALSKEDIFSLYKTTWKKLPDKKSKINYTETETDITVHNAYYSLSLKKKNGAIVYIKDKISNKIIVQGSSSAVLWNIVFKNGKHLKSNNFFKADSKMQFNYKWIKKKNILKLYYNDVKTGSVFIVKILFSKKHFFDFQFLIKNKFQQPVITAVLPYSIVFPINKLKKFYFPWKMGIYFNKNFFLSRKYISEPYPFLFADFISLESENGNLSVYMIQKKNDFQQTKLNVGYNAHQKRTGMYGHEFAVYIKKNSSWDSPLLRFSIGSAVEETIMKYAKDNSLDKALPLKKKITKKLFNHLMHGVLLKIDFVWSKMTFKEIETFIQTLPKSTILHLLSFWPKGFDQNYPDYLPPDPAFGTSNDLKHFIKTAHKNNLLIMPYTNPTWWNETLTLDELGKENIAVRKLDKSIHDEYYWGKNWGIVVSPHHPKVIKRINQTVKEMADELKCDLLFEDQLGARHWVYDLNSKSKAPANYTKGIINIAKRNHKKIPLMTEGGFDQLIPYETGFCDMSVNKALPPDKKYNTWWGKGNWKIYPMMFYFAHSKVAIYQHNLAHEVFTDAKEKLTWNLAYGHNLFLAWWPSGWQKLKKWFKIAVEFQKSVAGRCLGKNLTEFQEINDKVTWSRFQDIGIIANHDLKQSFAVDKYVLAKGGFFAKSQQNDLLAGLFTFYNQRRLADECYIIEERKKNKIIIKQLSQKDTLISIARPDKWKNSDWIQCLSGKCYIPVSVNSKIITFLSEFDKADYQLIYQKPKDYQYGLHLALSREEAMNGDEVIIKFIVQNKGKKILKQGRLELRNLILNYKTVSIDENEGKKVVEVFKNLKPGRQVEKQYSFMVPESIKPYNRVWIKGTLIYQDNGKEKKQQIRTDLFVKQSLQIQVDGDSKIIQPGDKYVYTVNLKNSSSEKIKAMVNIDIKGDLKKLLKTRKKKVVIQAKTEKKVSFEIQVPDIFKKGNSTIKAQIKIKDYSHETRKTIIEVIPLLKQVTVKPHILINKQQQKFTVRVGASIDKSFSGTIQVEFPSTCKVDKNKREINLVPGEVKDIHYNIFPNKDGRKKIKIIIKHNNKKIEYVKDVSIINNNEVAVIKSDIDDDGYSDIVIGNNQLELCVATVMGGRLLYLYNRKTGNNQLYTDYPGVELLEESSENWMEYGGINDCLPVSWPGDIWNNKWDYDICSKGPGEVVLLMKTKTRNNIALSRRITIVKQSSEVKLDYSIQNLNLDKVDFVWANHPDLAPGPDENADTMDKIIVPLKDKILQVSFGSKKQKNSYQPYSGWCVALDSKTGEYFGQKFDKRLVKEIGVWEGIIFFTMELIFKEIELKAEEKKDFTIYYIIGKDDWKQKVGGYKFQIH